MALKEPISLADLMFANRPVYSICLDLHRPTAEPPRCSSHVGSILANIGVIRNLCEFAWLFTQGSPVAKARSRPESITLHSDHPWEKHKLHTWLASKGLLHTEARQCPSHVEIQLTLTYPRLKCRHLLWIWGNPLLCKSPCAPKTGKQVAHFTLGKQIYTQRVHEETHRINLAQVDVRKGFMPDSHTSGEK